jgi:hypothetical protein
MLADRFHGRPMHPLVKRSVWALVPVYNKLGSGAQTICNVKLFQQYLHERVKTLISKNLADPDRWGCE